MFDERAICALSRDAGERPFVTLSRVCELRETDDARVAVSVRKASQDDGGIKTSREAVQNT
jgi:hypothetical protein